ncbi:Lanthionine biosynthesis protein LanM [Archangium gephyra]|uniref:Lanthionine biosynthesis protein LanM n=1 Tax=Archangium gephyra TaxID=48 RepID=A0AAC8QEN9_9BACT|nr:Lanthionine biosynthesis protein LanM [Archangium gephyra]
MALEAATRLGRTLCESAFWEAERQRCNWMGRNEEVYLPGAQVPPTSAALGPLVYSGSAGVALFLSELSEVTGEPAFREAALGGIRRSTWHYLHRPAGTAPVSALSFFSGALGAAYVAWRIAGRDPGAGLDGELDALLGRVSRALSEPHPLDLIGGNAGAIPALLAMAKTPAWRLCRDVALRCGEELCAAAEWQGGVAVWPHEKTARGPLTSPPLTGLAHGASGIALALLELYAATGEGRFRNTARGAFAYEDSLFSPAHGNWPDLRVFPGVAPSPTPAYSSAWCHGAPGIALARLRAMTLDPEQREVHAAVARTALSTTAAALERTLAQPRADATLCHGGTGLSEVMLSGAEQLGDGTYRSLAEKAVTTLVERYATSGDWPSGVLSNGPNPSLMLGTAGIGHHLLRLHAPERVAPVLVLTP